MKTFDHENLSTKAQSEAKELPRALLLDSSALGLLRMDDNQTAEDLLRIIGRSAKAEFGDETVEINSLVHFLWATAKGLNPTAPAFGERKWDKKTLLQISQLKVQLHATEREVLFDQTQEEEQAEDGTPAADRDREEAAEEELDEEEEDSSISIDLSDTERRKSLHKQVPEDRISARWRDCKRIDRWMKEKGGTKGRRGITIQTWIHGRTVSVCISTHRREAG